MERLTPGNKDGYLFDEVLWVEHAQREHDAFAATLADLGVEVHLLGDLLTETLAVPEARKHVLEASFDERLYGPGTAELLTQTFAGLDDATLVRHLVGGITRRELAEVATGLAREHTSMVVRSMDPSDLVLAPLPNHLFTRDTSAWLYGRGGGELDAQEGPPARDHPLRGPLPLAPAVRRRRLRGLVPRLVPRAGHRRGRGRAGARRRGGAGGDERAHHRAGHRAAGAQPAGRRLRDPRGGPPAAGAAGVSCTWTP